MNPAPKNGNSGPLSVERILGALGFLGDQRDGATLVQVSRAIESPKTSIFDLLKGLVHAGYVVRDDAGRYRLGGAAYSLGARMLSGREIVDLARPYMQRLAEETGETTLLGVPSSDRDMATYIGKVESRNSVRYTVPIGDQKPLYCTAIGKLLLAYMNEEELARYLRSHKLKAVTPRTIIDPRLLRAELQKIRTSQVSVADRERVDDLCAIASPVIDGSGTCVGGLVIGGPSSRVRAALKENIERVRSAARDLSSLIGFTPGILAERPLHKRLARPAARSELHRKGPNVT